MFEILILISWVAATALIGWSALSLIAWRKGLSSFSPAETAALSFPVGLGLVSIQMACFSALGIAWRTSCILLCWIPVFLAAFYSTVIASRRRRRSNLFRLLRMLRILATFGIASAAFRHKDQRTRHVFWRARPRNDEKKIAFSIVEKLLILGISFQVFYAFFKSLIRPIESYDAVAIYALVAKIFYMARTIPSDFYRTFKDFVPHIEYPLLLPLSEDYFYTFLGSLNDILVKIIFPLFFVCLLVVFYSVLRHKLERKSALLFTFVLATIPHVAEYATNGYADILLAFYYSASLFYLCIWIREGNGAFLTVSFILSLLAIWTKTEALMLVTVNLLMALIHIIRERKGVRDAVLYFTLLLASMIVYLFLKKLMGLEVHADMTGLAFSDSGKILFKAFKRIPAILYEYQIQFFGPKKWNIIWIIFIFLFVIRFKKSFSKNFFFLTSALLLIFCGYTSIYMIMPRGIEWHLSTTASRFFIHFVPAVVLWIALTYEDMKLKT